MVLGDSLLPKICEIITFVAKYCTRQFSENGSSCSGNSVVKCSIQCIWVEALYFWKTCYIIQICSEVKFYPL